jgi:hypothetical protein
MPGSSTSSSGSATTTVTRRSVVTDTNGNLWDMANPNIIGIKSGSGGTDTLVETATGYEYNIPVSFSTSSAAFFGELKFPFSSCRGCPSLESR